MEKFEFYDNSKKNYISLSPTSPSMMFVPTEESSSWPLSNITSSQVNGIMEGATQRLDQIINYTGISTINVPFEINPDFCDFKLSSQTIEEEDLFLNDSDQKIITLKNKIQLLEIPLNRFKNLTSGAYNYGNYYLYIQPKCITTTVKEIVLGERKVFTSIEEAESQTSNPLIRNSYYKVDRTSFTETSTLWDLFNSLYINQKGRLLGSVVEIYGSDEKLKTTKFIVFDDINSEPEVKLALSPDYIGFDSPQQSIIVGDILKIYPRETYFNPIPLELIFQSLNNTTTGLIQYMKNDVVRDTVTNIYEIYDDQGVDISEGEVNGKVVQSYQIVQVGEKECRVNLKLE